MNETLIALLVTLAVVVGCNVLAVVVRKRHPGLADKIVRYAPLMAAAASSKDREVAIRNLLAEVLLLESTEAKHARQAALALIAKPKPPTADEPPKPQAPKPPTTLGGSLCFAVLALSLVSCTPAERAQAKAIGVPVAQVVGGVCEQISGVMRDDVGGAFVDFACTVVRAAGSVIGNLDTRGGVAVDMPDGPPVKVTVRVYLEGGRTEVLP
jgi:hypothetical protein